MQLLNVLCICALSVALCSTALQSVACDVVSVAAAQVHSLASTSSVRLPQPLAAHPQLKPQKLNANASASASATAPKGKCYTLALSGGGDKAAYEIGALLRLIQLMEPEQMQYNAISGISAGANLAAFMSQFDKGDELQMATELADNTMRTKQSNVYRNHKFGGKIAGFFKSSLMDSEPLREWLTAGLSLRPTTQTRSVFIGATDLSSGELLVFNTRLLTKPQIVAAVMASSAIPGILQPVKLNNRLLIDGGINQGIEPFSGITECLKQGYKEEDIYFDTIMSSTRRLQDDYDINKVTSWAVFRRSSHIQAVLAAQRAIDEVKQLFPRVTHRFAIYPSRKLPGHGIDFKPEFSKIMLKQGNQDAEAAVQEWKAREKARLENEAKEAVAKQQLEQQQSQSEEDDQQPPSDDPAYNPELQPEDDESRSQKVNSLDLDEDEDESLDLLRAPSGQVPALLFDSIRSVTNVDDPLDGDEEDESAPPLRATSPRLPPMH